MKKIILFLFLALILNASFGQKNYIKWKILAKIVSKSEIQVTLTAALDSNMKIYSMYCPTKNNTPLKTEITFSNGKNSSMLFNQRIKELTKPRNEHKPVNNIDLKYFETKAVYRVNIKFTKGKKCQFNIQIKSYVYDDKKNALFHNSEGFTITISEKEVIEIIRRKTSNKQISRIRIPKG